MSTSPTYCLICKGAHVRPESPANVGWEWLQSAKAWVCAQCLAPPFFPDKSEAEQPLWDDLTEPNIDPEWLALKNKP